MFSSRKNSFLLFLYAVFHALIPNAEQAQPENNRFECNKQFNIDMQFFCDGTSHCSDSEDEKQHAGRSAPTDEWQGCVNSKNNYTGQCLVHRDLICRKELECSNVTPCDLDCDTHYRCQKSERCESRATVCNGKPCDGCPESHDWKNGVGFKCFRLGIECILPQQLVLDDISDCDGGIDRCFEITHVDNITSRRFLSRKCFRCLNDEMIIPRSRVCDGVINCSDLSDECLCEGNKIEICDRVIQFTGKVFGDAPGNTSTDEQALNPLMPRSVTCKVGDVQCGNGNCIARSSVCDGIKDCDEDEKFDYCEGTIRCEDATQYEDVCRCQTCSEDCRICYGTACNGIADCDSMSSHQREMVTKSGSFNTFPEDECAASCSNENTTFKCMYTVPFSRPWKPEACLNRGSKSVQVPEGWQICNGVWDCAKGDDEKNCTQRLKCDAVRSGYVSVSREETCDGFPDCIDKDDETEELCKHKRFQCPALGNKMVNIDKHLVCDAIVTCDNGEDELNCTEDGRFYCESGDTLFVKARQKFDGRGDCDDWSDECPLLHPALTRFSSRYQMIGNPILRSLMWIMGLISIVGNVAVLCIVSRNLKIQTKLSASARANKMLIINLAVSDMIIGIYLLGMGIAGLTMQDQYCSLDKTWRSSSACAAFGVMVTLSSESSVITMIMLTSCRLYAIFRPFQSSTHPKKGTIALMILLSWATSLMIALVPLSASLSETFVKRIHFTDNPFLKSTDTSLDEARKLFNLLATYDLKPNVTISGRFETDTLSWNEIQLLADEFYVHEHFKVERSFGYYSAASVCLPMFLVTKADRSWVFQFSVNLFNFLAFAFVALSYLSMYVQARKRSKLRSSSSTPNANSKESLNLEKKIFRLIITDFCCWIPLCIVTFANIGGAQITDKLYSYAGIILLPINSALNPIVYSNLLDVLLEKARQCLTLLKSSSTVKDQTEQQPSSRPERTIDEIGAMA